MLPIVYFRFTIGLNNKRLFFQTFLLCTFLELYTGFRSRYQIEFVRLVSRMSWSRKLCKCKNWTNCIKCQTKQNKTKISHWSLIVTAPDPLWFTNVECIKTQTPVIVSFAILVTLNLHNLKAWVDCISKTWSRKTGQKTISLLFRPWGGIPSAISSSPTGFWK